MTNETTRLSDEQVKAIFKANKRTSEFEVLSIEFTPSHYVEGIGMIGDKYIVETTGGKYLFEQRKKQNWTSIKTQYYNRICKL